MRPAARQLRRSLLDYAAGPSFEPAAALSVEQIIRSLLEPSGLRHHSGR